MGEGHQRRASRSAVSPFSFSPRLPKPAPPSPEEPSLIGSSPGALSIVSAFTTGSGARKTRRFGGARTLAFLQPPPFFGGVRVFGCFYSPQS